MLQTYVTFREQVATLPKYRVRGGCLAFRAIVYFKKPGLVNSRKGFRVKLRMVALILSIFLSAKPIQSRVAEGCQILWGMSSENRGAVFAQGLVTHVVQPILDSAPVIADQA